VLAETSGRWLERQCFEGLIDRSGASQGQALDVAFVVANDDALEDVIDLVQRDVDIDLGILVDGGGTNDLRQAAG
jgi:hypothetical protein